MRHDRCDDASRFFCKSFVGSLNDLFVRNRIRDSLSHLYVIKGGPSGVHPKAGHSRSGERRHPEARRFSNLDELIAFQITNWNEVRTNRTGLISSLERLDKEVALNLEISNAVLEIFQTGRDDLDLARDALSKCEASPEATAALERTLFLLVEDLQPNFVLVALDQLARQVTPPSLDLKTWQKKSPRRL